MIGYIAYAEGSPCPTLVLDAGDLPGEPGARLAALVRVRRWLGAGGGEHILKIAVIEPARHPMFDLDYQFFQAMPDRLDHFDLKGSCGHSVLSAIVAAVSYGMLPPLRLQERVQVHVLNNGDHLTCEVDHVSSKTAQFTVHFVRSPRTAVRELLITGEPQTRLEVDGTDTIVSLVSAGNPYVFVGGEHVGVHTPSELFDGGKPLFDRLVGIRMAAARQLGWAAESAFPKVAVVLPGGHARLAVRAVSVPRWHPTLALTGAACVAAATAIPGTIPWQAATQAGTGETFTLDTPGGSTMVSAGTEMKNGIRELAWTSVRRKLVTSYGSLDLEASPAALAALGVKGPGTCSLAPIT